MKYSKDFLIETLRDFFVANKRLPCNREFGQGGGLASRTAHVNMFGSMEKAYEAAGLLLHYKKTPQQTLRIPEYVLA